MERLFFGADENTFLDEPLDTWLSANDRDVAVPEAAGSSARVFTLHCDALAGRYGNHAVIKVMRPDKIAYARPLFLNEIKILLALGTKTGCTRLLRVGYLNVAQGTFPAELAPLSRQSQVDASATNLTGELHLYKPEAASAFLKSYDQRIEDNWLPVIVLERRWEDNLYLLCDAGYTRGAYLDNFSVADALFIAGQICSLVAYAHQQNIAYLDHKILHYYWNSTRRQVMMIDWNVSSFYPEGISADMIAFDVLQMCARALHHLLTGRQAPGSLAIGPNRPDEILAAPTRYQPNWIFDDEKRLTAEEMAFLESAISGQYKTCAQVQEELQQLWQNRVK